MAEHYILKQDRPLTITTEDADRLLSLHSGDAALLYLYLLRTGGTVEAKAAASLGLTIPYAECMELLQKAGLVQTAAPEAAAARPIQKPFEIPEYTAEEVRSRTEADAGFHALLNETAGRLGRMLTGADMKILFGIYDYLGLPTDVILLLLSWCVQETQRKFGPGRMPTMRQVEKEAYLWASRDLFTVELADRYLRDRQSRHAESAAVAAILGIRDRAISATEEKYITAWLDMGFRQEAILKAYDKTVIKKGELHWPYMNRILENWHQKGLHTLPEIEAGDKMPQAGGRSARQAAEKPVEADLQQMQDYLDRLNGGGKHGT